MTGLARLASIQSVRIYGWFTPEVLAEAVSLIVPWKTKVLKHTSLLAGMLLAGLLVAAGGLIAPALMMQGRNFGLAIFCLCLLPGYLLLQWFMRKGVRMDALLEWFQQASNPFDMTLTPVGIRIVSKQKREFFLPWSRFDQFYEGKFLTLVLNSTNGRYCPIPTHVLLESTRDELSRFLAMHLTRIATIPKSTRAKIRLVLPGSR